MDQLSEALADTELCCKLKPTWPKVREILIHLPLPTVCDFSLGVTTFAKACSTAVVG